MSRTIFYRKTRVLTIALPKCGRAVQLYLCLLLFSLDVDMFCLNVHFIFILEYRDAQLANNMIHKTQIKLTSKKRYHYQIYGFSPNGSLTLGF